MGIFLADEQCAVLCAGNKKGTGDMSLKPLGAVEGILTLDGHPIAVHLGFYSVMVEPKAGFGFVLKQCEEVGECYTGVAGAEIGLASIDGVDDDDLGLMVSDESDGLLGMIDIGEVVALEVVGDGEVVGIEFDRAVHGLNALPNLIQGTFLLNVEDAVGAGYFEGVEKGYAGGELHRCLGGQDALADARLCDEHNARAPLEEALGYVREALGRCIKIVEKRIAGECGHGTHHTLT